jgi:hypothetical protein
MKPRALAALVALVTLITGHHAASAAPVSLDALVKSFDQALAIVSEAAEKRIAEIEQRRPDPTSRVPRFAELEAQIDVACDIASDVLDYTISTTELSGFQRSVVRACVDRHVWEARRDLEAETDPRVRTEYLVTYERLQEVRRLV